jgi:hypothetical protein
MPRVHDPEDGRPVLQIAEQPGELPRPDVHDVGPEAIELLAQGPAQAGREALGAKGPPQGHRLGEIRGVPCGPGALVVDDPQVALHRGGPGLVGVAVADQPYVVALPELSDHAGELPPVARVDGVKRRVGDAHENTHRELLLLGGSPMLKRPESAANWRFGGCRGPPR